MLSNLFSENICDICEDGIFDGFRRSLLLFVFCRKRFMNQDNLRLLILTLLAFLTWMVSSPSSMRMPSGVFMAEMVSDSCGNARLRGSKTIYDSQLNLISD